MQSTAQALEPENDGQARDESREDATSEPCRAVRLRPAVARQHLERAIELTESGRSVDAVDEIVTGLAFHPGMPKLYHQLGHVLRAIGLKPLAQACFRGAMPGELIEHHYPNCWPLLNDTHPTQARAAGVDRHTVFDAVSTPLPPTRGPIPPREPMFDTRSIDAAAAHVHVVVDGQVWFDGHNRLVLSRDGTMLTSHAYGSPAVVYPVASACEPTRVEGRAYMLAARGFNNYYHWLFDILPAFALFDAVDLAVRPEDRVIVAAAGSAFHRAALDRLGVRPEQIVETSGGSPFIGADELVVPQFSNAMGLTMAPWVTGFLRDRFLSPRVDSPVGATRLYLARADDARNGRAIGNQDELIRRLEARGFAAVFPERYSLLEQAALFASAEIVVASHGAGLTNIVFCKPGTPIVELFGDHQAPCYWAISALCGLRHHSLFCTGPESGTGGSARDPEGMAARRRRGFSVDLDALDTVLDMAETHTS